MDGKFGPRTIAATQRWVGAKVDGVWGVQSKRALQDKLGVKEDGEVGPITIKALLAKIGARVDSMWGPDTVRHLQEYPQQALSSTKGSASV